MVTLPVGWRCDAPKGQLLGRLLQDPQPAVPDADPAGKRLVPVPRPRGLRPTRTVKGWEFEGAVVVVEDAEFEAGSPRDTSRAIANLRLRAAARFDPLCFFDRHVLPRAVDAGPQPARTVLLDVRYRDRSWRDRPHGHPWQRELLPDTLRGRRAVLETLFLARTCVRRPSSPRGRGERSGLHGGRGSTSPAADDSLKGEWDPTTCSE